jgi:hypothetical protein
MMALRAGPSKPERAAVQAGKMNSGHSNGPRSALMARATDDNPMRDPTMSSSLRRSTASATAPPMSDPIIRGPSSAKLTKPTSREEPVMA